MADPDRPVSGGPRPVTRRAGPLVVLIGVLALASGLPAGRLTSFGEIQQIAILAHALLGLIFVGVFLLFIGIHVRETTGERRTGLWLWAIFVYAGVREVFLREFAFIYPLLYFGPILLAWWVVDQQLRRTLVTLAVAVPVVGVVLAIVLGSDPVLTIFTLPYYAEILCIVALVMGRPSVQGASPGPNASARKNGLYYTFAALSAGVSGIFLALGTGQMQVGRGFRDAHTGTSLLLLVAGLYHARSGAGVRRALGLDNAPRARLVRWAAATAVAGGLTAAGVAYVLRLNALHDPPTRPVFVAAAMAMPSNWVPANNHVLDNLDFRDPNSCKGCHAPETQQWNVSAHRFSASPALRLLVQEARKLRGIEAERYCLGCHAPRAILTGELQGDGHASEESLAAGVGCLTCHEAQAASGQIGNGSHVLVSDPPLLFERAADYDGYFTPALIRLTPRLHIRRYSKPYLRDARLCAGCHLERQSEMLGAHTGVLQDTFTSWSKSDYAKPGADGRPAASCGDCHMPRVWLSTKQEGIHDHRMFGGPETYERDGVDEATKRVAAAWLQGDRTPLLADAREAFRQRYAPRQPTGSAFDRSTETLWEEKIAGREFPPAEIWPPGPLIAMDVKLVNSEGSSHERVVVALTNRAIGHDFPAGPRDVVEAWLRVEVRDATGQLVLASGTAAGATVPDSEAHRFGGEPVDASGKHVERHHIWEIADIRNDRVIPPKATVEESFPLPSDGASLQRPVTVDAALLYRFPGSRIVRELLGDAAAPPAPVTLAHAHVSVP